MSAWTILTAVREDPEVLRRSQQRRGLDSTVVDEAVRLDTEWRKTRTELAEFQRQRNQIAKQIGKEKGKEKKAKLIQESKRLSEKVSAGETRLAELETARKEALHSIANIVHDSVPDGMDETEARPVKYVGKPRVWKEHIDQFIESAQGLKVEYEVVEKQPESHYDISEHSGMIDTTRAAKVAGSRFYYLIDDIVWLDLGLALYALDNITQHGFTPIIPPNMLNQAAYSGVTDISAFEDSLYKLENQDLYLIATSEHPIAAQFMNEVLEINELPLYLAGYSPCYRKEAGAHGKDTKGIFRVHQFSKVEMFMFCLPEDSWNQHEKMISIVEKIWKPLGIPFRIVILPSGDFSRVAAKTYDLELWMPSQGRYREFVSASNCTDYQSVRLNTRYAEKRGHPTKGFVHTLNSTVIATTRTMTAVLENNIQEDGRILIPKPLLPYLKPIEAAPDKYLIPIHMKKR
ncbi:MAG: serine--tRNA ligase [Candidatus Hermodarchaeota archaeon]|nr:serine--tRNA ligase [Candidatus Hermodarchaeota archaeon]